MLLRVVTVWVFLTSCPPLATQAQEASPNDVHAPPGKELAGASDSSTIRRTLADSPGWTSYSFSPAVLRQFPSQSIFDLIALVPDIVSLNGGLHARGSRDGELVYQLDGILVTNRFLNSPGVPFLPEMLEELTVHTGPVGATLGSANGGLVAARFKRGADTITFSLDVRTDDFTTPGGTMFNTTVQGFRHIVGTVGGPLPFDTRFFLAGQHTFTRNRQPMFLEGFRYDSLRTDGLFSTYPPGRLMPGPLEFQTNYLHNNWLSRSILQGTLTGHIYGFDVQVWGSYSFEEAPEKTAWPHALTNAFRRKPGLVDESRTSFGAVRVQYEFDPAILLSATYARSERFDRSYDPDFGDSWQLYSDSLEARKRGHITPAGDTGFRSRYFGPPPYSVIYGFNFLHEFSPNTSYSKRLHSSSTLSFDLSWKPSQNWDITVGGLYESWIMREFTVPFIATLMSQLESGFSRPLESLTEEERRLIFLRFSGMKNYGFDYLGNEVGSGPDAPRIPRFWSFYGENIYRDNNLMIRLGGRLEGFDLRLPVMPLEAILSGEYIDYSFYPFYGSLREDRLQEQEPTVLFLPRVHVVYDVGPGTSVSAGFGKYAQITKLENLLYGNQQLLNLIGNPLPSTYRLGTTFVGYLAQPERTTQYEFLLRQRLSASIDLSVGAFVKAGSNQLQVGHVRGPGGDSVYVALLNQGESLSKGATMQLFIRTLNGFSIIASYGLLEASGLSSHPASNRKQYTDNPDPSSPTVMFPLEFDVRHSASLLLEYRPASTITALEGLSLVSSITFSSGHRYTRLQEHRFLGAGTLWNSGVRPLADPRTEIPLEPANASTTPSLFNIDLRLGKVFQLGPLRLEAYVIVLNVLDSKHVLNVYPNSGYADDDSWLQTPIVVNQFYQIPGYVDFYRTINLQNRWAYMSVTGNDVYGAPRQFRIGLEVSL